MAMKLTVSIPTTPDRLTTTFPLLVAELERQAKGLPVEILAVLDNETISLGRKQNEMARIASGRFISCVGDDDRVRPEYVDELLDHIDAHPDADVICFDTAYWIGGEQKATIYESKDHVWGEDWEAGKLYRYPSDKMCWNREFFLAHPHNDAMLSDINFAFEAVGAIQREVQVGLVLYDYDYDPRNPKGNDYKAEQDRSRRAGR